MSAAKTLVVLALNERRILISTADQDTHGASALAELVLFDWDTGTEYMLPLTPEQAAMVTSFYGAEERQGREPFPTPEEHHAIREQVFAEYQEERRGDIAGAASQRVVRESAQPTEDAQEGPDALEDFIPALSSRRPVGGF